MAPAVKTSGRSIMVWGCMSIKKETQKNNYNLNSDIYDSKLHLEQNNYLFL